MFDFFGWKKEVEEIRTALVDSRTERDLAVQQVAALEKELLDARSTEARLLAKNREDKAELNKLKKDLNTACQNLRSISAVLANQILLRQRVEKLNKNMLEQINLFSVPQHVLEIQIP